MMDSTTMTLRRKANRSQHQHHNQGASSSTTTSTSTGSSKEAIHVKNFMQSIDPSVHTNGRQPNYHIPFSCFNMSSPAAPTPAAAAPPATSTAKSPSLPFFPDPVTFGTPSSFVRKMNKNKRSSPQNKQWFSSPFVASSITSASSSPYASPPMFYPSNRLRLKAKNAIRVPCIRKNLFLSPTHALARRDSNNDSIRKERSYNTRSSLVPFQQDSATKINKKSSSMNMNMTMNKNHSFSITNSTSRYSHFSNIDPSNGLFEADPPVMGRKSFPFVLQTPTRSPESAMGLSMSMTTPTKGLSTPPKRIGLFASPSRATTRPTTSSTHAASIVTVTNPILRYASFTPTTSTTTSSTAMTPKHFIIDTRNKSSMRSPYSDAKNANTNTNGDGDGEDCSGKVRQSIIPAPALRLQPSVGTTMAASALMSMMAMAAPQQGSSSRNCKRDLGAMAVESHSPFKKYRMSPPRISHFLLEAPSTSIERPHAIRTKEDGENCRSLSNLSDHGIHSMYHTVSNERDSSARRSRKESSRIKSKQQYVSSKSRRKSTTINSAAPSSISVSTTSGPSKRIPRRFTDDPSLPVFKSGMQLACPDDRKELNSLHCFVRSELLEVFAVEESKIMDVADSSDETNEKTRSNGSSGQGAGRASRGNKNHREPPVHQIQRVGIRCIHCGHKPKCERAGTSMSAFFPKSLQDIYRGVCTWQRIHFHACKHIPQDLKVLYKYLKDSDRSRGKKEYWVRSALDMGFRNVDENRNGMVWVGGNSSITGTTSSTSTSISPREGAMRSGAMVERVKAALASHRHVVTLDLTKFDDAIKAGAVRNPGDEEAYNY